MAMAAMQRNMEGGQADEDVLMTPQHQKMICEFGRLQSRVVELRADIETHKLRAEEAEDAASEVMLADGKVRLAIGGESFFDVDEDTATEFCERKQAQLTAKLVELKKDEAEVSGRQEELKRVLYAHFGSSINLEA